jgi:UDPglucose 6-dehydrogenase
MMNIAVAGLWHLGAVTAACLAAAGYRVIGFDEDEETIAGLQEGRPPVFEPGLQDLISSGREAGRLSFSSDPKAIGGAQIVWIAYDTPVDEDDRADVASVMERIAALLPHIAEGVLVLLSAQLPVGSTRRLEEIYKNLRPGGTATFAYSPENLRLGKAIEAFSRPDRVVVGARAATDKARIATLLKPFTERIEWVSVESAEMTKHALNAFLATSVAFVNELAALCERAGADAGEVERGLRTDARIGPKAYLRPGGAFSGGTLARDLSFLVERSRAEGLPAHLLAGVERSNKAHQRWPRRRLAELFGSVAARSIAVLGLTYKPGTDTLRRSSAIETCRWLHEQGAAVSAYDPAVKALPAELRDAINLRPSIEAAARGASALLIATEWPEFSALRADDLVGWMRQPVVLDPGRFLEAQLGRDERIRYLAVGRRE